MHNRSRFAARVKFFSRAHPMEIRTRRERKSTSACIRVLDGRVSTVYGDTVIRERVRTVGEQASDR